ncbi:hypothetical protein [Candidatus Pantoea bituminis]|uniref:hypothetical protein n=1 Tax=Candidatus Pantoea bituminis TaxID=2831036 RepID=UPI001C0639A4|nr:hypothetical protein [Pantoea bituminis]
MSTYRCTTAQAIVRYLSNQFTEIDDQEVPLFPGVFGIFGHGNVTCMGKPLKVFRMCCQRGAARMNSQWDSPRRGLPKRACASRLWWLQRQSGRERRIY